METGKMLGGLYKKSTYLEQYKKKQGQVIFVDSGDLLNGQLKIKDSIRPSMKSEKWDAD